MRTAPRTVVRECDAVLARDPDNAAALIVRGLAHHALGAYGLGLRDIQRAITLDGRLAAACHVWARVGDVCLSHLVKPRRSPVT